MPASSSMGAMSMPPPMPTMPATTPATATLSALAIRLTMLACWCSCRRASSAVRLPWLPPASSGASSSLASSASCAGLHRQT
jgi:hypothetical protein